MFINYADFIDNNLDGYINKDIPLQINSCGNYRLIKRNEVETCRPSGRLDYQLIYIAHGKGYFYFDDSKAPNIINSGNMIIYKPYDFQRYIFYSKDHTDIFWIHFTGNDITDLFNKYGLNIDNKVIPCGTDPLYNSLFEKIILELQFQKDYFSSATSLIFNQLLISISRSSKDNSNATSISGNEINAVISYFHNHYQESINVEEYIKTLGYSTSSFFKKFKGYTHVTPLQYLINIRLKFATHMLKSSNYKVSEISRLVGYDNPLYFSRLFHKHIGMSPEEYRSKESKNDIEK